MFSFLFEKITFKGFGSKSKGEPMFRLQNCERARELTEIFKKLKKIYRGDDISEERKLYIKSLVEKYGYLPYPHIRALEELNAADTFYGLEIKWNLNKVMENKTFQFEENQISPVTRAGFTDSDWIKKEGHDIKLVNLASLGNGNYSPNPGNFIDWLKQILILPSGNLEKSILGTTIYLIPFHPRDFGCAYFPISTGVSENIKDNYLCENLNITSEQQVQLFVHFAQLAGHPVIYDILPQTARFSKNVLAFPYIARWIDINYIIEELQGKIDTICEKLKTEFDKDDVTIVKNIAKSALNCGSDDIGDPYLRIYKRLNEELFPIKKQLSEKMLAKSNQVKLQERVKSIVKEVIGEVEIKDENSIVNQGRIVKNLIAEGLWTVPGGAWCSSGIPIFDKMAEYGDFPVFKHLDIDGNDVSKYANLDCQTPYYFACLENGDFNTPVVDYFISMVKDLKNKYNFDGIRVDHVDHIVDKYSVKGNKPISYRIPKQVLAKLNEALKQQSKTTASVAEYMLGGDYVKEYHKDMHFDVLWGDDIIAQNRKTPYEIINNNQKLTYYNEHSLAWSDVSVLKTYNNQDGEFRFINQYPGQLGEKGALFKWLKLKFIPGGKKAQRPVMYVDGDESFTPVGTEEAIGVENSLKRAKNYYFFEQFDAINRFAKNNDIITEGTAQLITQTDKGFVCWIVSKPQEKDVIMVVANYFPPIQKVQQYSKDGSDWVTLKGPAVVDASITLPRNYKMISEYTYNSQIRDFEEKPFSCDDNGTIKFAQLNPSDYRIFKLQKDK